VLSQASEERRERRRHRTAKVTRGESDKRRS
jgi:hypothetical protein